MQDESSGASERIVTSIEPTIPDPVEKVKYYTDLITQIDFVVTILIGLLIWLWREISNRTPGIVSLININYKKDQAINSSLKDLRMASDADRVVIGIFHNSQKYAFDYHLLKMSVFHESLKDNSFSVKKIIRDIPLSYISEELALYKLNNNKLLFNISNPNMKPGCKLHLNSINIETICNYLLEYKRTPIGILSFQYKTDQSSKYGSISEFEKFLNANIYKDIDYYISVIVNNVVRKA